MPEPVPGCPKTCQTAEPATELRAWMPQLATEAPSFEPGPTGASPTPVHAASADPPPVGRPEAGQPRGLPHAETVRAVRGPAARESGPDDPEFGKRCVWSERSGSSAHTFTCRCRVGGEDVGPGGLPSGGAPPRHGRSRSFFSSGSRSLDRMAGGNSPSIVRANAVELMRFSEPCVALTLPIIT